jgi:2,3-bisphosphoglycerate-independent phosphoglycerate mutase
MKKKAILVILDGLGDLPTPKTPLQAAKKPNLDKLAKNGCTGLLSPLGRGIVPGSDTSHLQILGYDPNVFYCGRGPLEALGLGMKLEEGDVAFRSNFATVKNGVVVDRRAGRIKTEDARKFEKYLSTKIEDVEVMFKHSVQHRGAVILRGGGLSPGVSDTDPHEKGEVLECHAHDEKAEKTARIVNKYMEFAREKLSEAPENKKRKKKGLPEANALLLRGAGIYTKIPSMIERFDINAACIAGGALYKGVATYIGMDVFLLIGDPSKGPEMLEAKKKAVKRALKEYDFVFIHIKATDNYSHDGDFEGKKKIIEKVDREFISELAKTGAYLIITGDHTTPVSRREHSGHEVPILIYGKDERTDKVKKFDEISCMEGGLGHLEGKDIMPIILNLLEKAHKYGS